MASTAVSGAAFGAALVVAGVYQPSVIIDQLTWDNYHMLQAFLSATAASTLIITTAQKLGYAKFSPRQYADRGLPGNLPYDGNVVGGLFLGAGMALCGACPGTVLVQTTLNYPSGYYALGGGILGGIAWAGLFRPLLDARKKRAKTAAEAAAPPSGSGIKAPPPNSVDGLLGVSKATAVVGVEVTLAAIAGSTAVLFGAGPDAKIPPVAGGLVIGAAQLVSVVLRKSTLGVSTMYEDVGDWMLYYAKSAASATSARLSSRAAGESDKAGLSIKAPAVNSIIFSLGIVAGARALITLLPYFNPSRSSLAVAAAITPTAGLLGGFLMAVGSRLAGGCTSGHGISGMALLSIPSYITMAFAFIGGGAVALLL